MRGIIYSFERKTKELLHLFQRNRKQLEKQVFWCCFISICAKTVDVPLGGGGGVTCICRDTEMCHYFGYLFGLSSRIFGYHFLLVKFDFFKNNPHFL